MNRVCRASAAALLIASTASAAGQLPGPEPANLRGESSQTRKRLTEAEQKLTAGQAADAVDALQRILDDAGDDLVSVDGKQYRTARHFAHQILSRLPADALKGYRDRIDNPARKLLEAAKARRDPAPLWRLLDRYFVSRPADEGLMLLGELLFERGEFRAAAEVWRQLLPDGGSDLAYPNSKAAPAGVRARIILARIFGGDAAAAKAELAAFKAKHPGAEGTLAGKTGPLAEALQGYLDAPPKVPPASAPVGAWPTFGGGPDRSGRLGAELQRYWPAGRPTWPRVPRELPQHHRAAGLPDHPPGRPPFGHPVIAGGRVFVTDGVQVAGFDLLTGEPLRLPRFPAPAAVRFDPENPPPEASPTLAAAGGRLYVRLGPPLVTAAEIAKGDGQETEIVCLGPDGERGMKECWRFKPPGEGKPAAVWEGAPLVAGRRLWAAYARFEGGRVVHGVACYDPADATAGPPNLLWDAEVCDSPIPTGGDPRARHELLTLAGRNVVFCSNAGAVVALDAASGERAWGFRYPRTRKSDANRTPDPSPAVFAAGRVFAAPADGEHVYAFDPDTGQLLWESAPTEGARILGVAAGRVIVSVTGPVRGLRGLGVATGSHREPDGWVLHDGGGLLTYGRGLVTDDALLWPTRDGLFFIRPADGRLLGPPLLNHLSGPAARYFGHLAYADGVLVVVTPTQVWGYVTEGKRFGDAGVRAGIEPARARFEELTRDAEAALAAGDGEAARRLLLAATATEFPNTLRAWAAARLLLLASRTDDEAKLPADVRAAIAPELRGEWLVPPDGVPVTLDALLTRHTGRAFPPTFRPRSPAPESDRKPGDGPTLAADAEIAHTLRLPAGSAPLRWLPGMNPPRRVFAATADELLVIPLAAGEETRHDAVGGFTHAAELPEGFVAAGPLVVAVYATDRSPVWVFRVPATGPLPAYPGEFRIQTGEAPSPCELSGFRLTGSWLVARLGERHLIALDLKGRRVAWVLGSDGSPGFRPLAFPDAPRFGAEFFAGGRLVVAQLSDGRRWFIEAHSGKVIPLPGSEQLTARVWWAIPPAEVEENRLAVSDGPGLVRMLNLATGRERWSYQAEGDTSLAGEPPQVRAWGSAILIAVRRNHGVDLDRLGMGEGRSEWTSHGPAFLDADRVNLPNADADAERVYVPAGKTLAAFALKDGKPAWEALLPDTHGAGGWVVKAGRRCVIAYPEAAIPREPVAGVFARVVKSFRNDPRAWRLPGLAAGLYDAWVARSVPVLLFDPETGKQLAEFEVPAAGPAVTAWFERDLAVVATGDRVVWLR
jgi:outer membrane protein assembly factor BamB